MDIGRMIALAILMLALQIADVYTTHRFLAAGMRELNPILRWSFDVLGFWPTMALKVALAIAATAVLVWMGWTVVLALLCGVYAFVVWKNWRLV